MNAVELDIVLIHNFGDKGMEKFDTKEGTIALTPQGLSIKVSSLSSFIITWEESEVLQSVPQTGDNASLLLYVLGVFVSAMAICLLEHKAKRT